MGPIGLGWMVSDNDSESPAQKKRKRTKTKRTTISKRTKFATEEKEKEVATEEKEKAELLRLLREQGNDDDCDDEHWGNNFP